MGEESTNQSDLARANKLGRRLELIVSVILTVCYLLQSAKNCIETWGLIILLLTLWVPIIVCFFVYKKNNASPLVKHIMGAGYGAFYIAVCLISEQQLVFTYVFPMLLVVTLYCNLKFSYLISTCVSVITIAHAVIFTARADWSDVAIAAMEIEIAATLLVCIYSILCNKFMVDMNNRHLKIAKDAEEKSEGMLSNILDVSTALTDEVQIVSDKMEALSKSSNESY